MKKLLGLEDLEQFVKQQRYAIIFCSATWVIWLPSYREELNAANLPIVELDIDIIECWELLRENLVSNVPAFMLYSDGRFTKTIVGRVKAEKLMKNDPPDESVII